MICLFWEKKYFSYTYKTLKKCVKRLFKNLKKKQAEGQAFVFAFAFIQTFFSNSEFSEKRRRDLTRFCF